MTFQTENAEAVLAGSERTQEKSGNRHLTPAMVVGLAAVCASAGLLLIEPSVRTLLDMWLTDDLKSMGLAVPFVSFLLILRAWRKIGWATEDGGEANLGANLSAGLGADLGANLGARPQVSRQRAHWWGFGLLAAMAVVVFVERQTLLVVTVDKDWLMQIPPLPLVAVLYATGMVLLLSGRRLLRAAWFPVAFMWAVIPVPQTFSNKVDLPLQHASATVARGFAHLLGQPLTEDRLRLMFTPEFGMFIAPGCNGIRGAITLGLAAVVVGYLFRFRWFVYAPVVAGAVLLGYLFNFLRLCLLVVYYKLALPYPWMQHHAKIADYLIGGALFVAALAVFFAVAERLRNDGTDVLAMDPVQAEAANRPARPYLLRVGALIALAMVFGLDARHRQAAAAVAMVPPPPLPGAVGDYRLVRSWKDTLVNGIVVYTWGEYASSDPRAAHVSLGISPRLDVHDAGVCHIARGEDPVWQGQIEAPSPGGEVALTAAMYNDGRIQRLEASTVCDGGTCRQFSRTSAHVSLIFAKPHGELPLGESAVRPVPVLLKVTTMDTTAASAEVEPRMSAALKDFVAQVDLARLTGPYARRN